MKSIRYFPLYLSCFAVMAGCLLLGCKRNIPIPPTGEPRNVTFKLSGFEAEISPLSAPQSTTRLAAGIPDKGVQALRNIVPDLESQYLYFWSFNEETLESYIAVDEVGAEIVFNGENTEPNFVAGFGLEPIDAGKALNIKGAQSVEISLPMEAIESLTTFDFDIGSSSTGPKDFSLSYSVDGGITFEVLSATNQFANMGSSSRNRYSFDMSVFPQFIGIAGLKIRLDFLPGDRGESGEYNERTGTLKIDNIRLSGVYNTEGEPSDPSAPGTLHYYIFSAADGAVVQQQTMALSALGEDGTLNVKLHEGRYDVLFLAYRADKGILLPEELTNANEFYYGQHFDDYRAVTYSVLVEDVEVGESDTEAAATLSRCYSLVEFDFTDLATDLQTVKKIVVTKGHENYLYTPFGTPGNVPISDAQSITFNGFDTPDDYRITLHQFFGLLGEGVHDVSYEVTAYGDGDVLLNAVTISEQMSNNVRLRLTGRLLGNSGTIHGFSIVLDTVWEETVDREF